MKKVRVVLMVLTEFLKLTRELVELLRCLGCLE